VPAYDNAVEKISEGVYRISIGQDQFETTGTATLIGVLSHACNHELTNVKKVVLSFPQTSLGWREKHGGPDILAVPEYAVPCMISDVLWFQKNNIEVVVEEPTDYDRL